MYYNLSSTKTKIHGNCITTYQAPRLKYMVIVLQPIKHLPKLKYMVIVLQPIKHLPKLKYMVIVLQPIKHQD